MWLALIVIEGSLENSNQREREIKTCHQHTLLWQQPLSRPYDRSWIGEFKDYMPHSGDRGERIIYTQVQGQVGHDG